MHPNLCVVNAIFNAIWKVLPIPKMVKILFSFIDFLFTFNQSRIDHYG